MFLSLISYRVQTRSVFSADDKLKSRSSRLRRQAMICKASLAYLFVNKDKQISMAIASRLFSVFDACHCSSHECHSDTMRNHAMVRPCALFVFVGHEPMLRRDRADVVPHLRPLLVEISLFAVSDGPIDRCGNDPSIRSSMSSVQPVSMPM